MNRRSLVVSLAPAVKAVILRAGEVGVGDEDLDQV